MDDRDRWNDRYREQANRVAAETDGRDGDQPDDRLAPPRALSTLGRHLPDTGTAVDLAGGTGDAALTYARSGLRAVLVDVSDVALDVARSRSDALDTNLVAVQLDLTDLNLAAAIDAVVAAGATEPVTAVSCYHYLNRPLLASVADQLPVGAVFLAAIATVTNLERNERPSGRFLLERGELHELVVGSPTGSVSPLEVLHWSEDWNDGGHHEAVLAVRRS